MAWQEWEMGAYGAGPPPVYELWGTITIFAALLLVVLRVKKKV